MREIIQDIKKPKRSLREVLPKRGFDQSAARTGPLTVKRVNESVRDEIEAKELDSNQTEGQIFRPKRGSYKIKLVGLVIFIIILVGLTIVGSSLFSQATVKLTPKKASIALVDQVLTASKNPSGTDELAFTLMTLETSESRLVPSKGTESVSKKTTGKIIIYNNYSTKSQSLVKGTRFEGKNGKIYRITAAVTVPGQKKQGTETVPGSVEATVEADKPGADYNSEPTDFTIPGFRGEPRFDKFYGRSKTPLAGGLIGQINLIDPAEKSKAKDAVEEIIKNRLLEEARTKVPAGFIFYDDAVFFNFKETGLEAQHKEGEETQYQESGTLIVPIFDEKKISSELARTKLTEPIGDTEVKVENLKALTFKLDKKNQIDLSQADKINFTLSGEAKLVWLINEPELKNNLLSLSKDGYSSVFSQYPAIKRAEVVFRPPWIRRFPNNPDKIKLEIVGS